MPWYCSVCSIWNKSSYERCPYCGGGATTGRRCEKCKTSVPAGGLYCPACGSDKILEGTASKMLLPRPVRLTVAALLLLGGCWGCRSLRVVPFLEAAVTGLETAIATVIGYTVAFWILTALLPTPARQWVRKATGWCLRMLARLVIGLVS